MTERHDYHRAFRNLSERASACSPSQGRYPTNNARTPSASILVVEDDEPIREFIRALLTDDGYHVLTACDGAEALAKVAMERPQVLILDMRLPGVSGSDVVAALRLRGERVPTIVTTASADARSAARAIGAEGWIAKPFDCFDLLRQVERLAATRFAEAS